MEKKGCPPTRKKVESRTGRNIKGIELGKNQVLLLKYLYGLSGRFNKSLFHRKYGIKQSCIYSSLSGLRKRGLIDKEFGLVRINNVGRKYVESNFDDKSIGVEINECYFCGYDKAIDNHHIERKCDGGKDNKENEIKVCPNCHSVIHRDNLSMEKIDGKYHAIDSSGVIILSKYVAGSRVIKRRGLEMPKKSSGDNVINGCPPTTKGCHQESPALISLGTTKLNVLKELAKDGNPHSISKILNCSRANVQKHLRNLRDKYKLAYKDDRDVCSVWTITSKGKQFLGGNLPVVTCEREGATYLNDRPHNIKIKFPIIQKPKDMFWLEGWKENNKLKNNVFYHQSFGDIQTTYTGKSMIFQLPIINFTDSELALAEAGRVAFSLARKYQNELDGLKLGKEELNCQVITQHHACQRDPYAAFCFKHNISYSDEMVDIDASKNKIPEIEFTDSEKSHIHHKKYVDNIKDILLENAPTNKELSNQIKEVLKLSKQQQESNNETAAGLSSVINILRSEYEKNKKEEEVKPLSDLRDNFRSYIN